MNRRKRIGLFVALPESAHVRRITEGIMTQCEKYGYDLCVFSPSIHLSFPHKDYTRGEANIYELANFDELDGLIMDSTTLVGDPGDMVQKRILDRIAKHPELPVCALEIPMGNLKVIDSDNEEALREMCRHAIKVHGRKRICILTGPESNKVSGDRLAIFLDEIQKLGLSVLPEHIIYGDFWYFSGDTLARRIADNEIPRPDAVLCASDCMAIGLIDRLVKKGIRVPEDIVVIGYDSSDEGAINPTTVTSYAPADKAMGADAVDYIRGILEPGEELIPYLHDATTQFHTGASCGCQTDPTYAMRRFRSSLYFSSYNQADEELKNQVSLGTFMESYAMEGFTASKSTEECVRNIYEYCDLLTPYENFYLCLKENWLDMDDIRYDGYPNNMRIYVASSTVGGDDFHGEGNAISFRTKKMLPKLEEQREKPSVFYFSPVHFDGQLLGYAVLQRKLCEHPTLNLVNRNWLRYINNALEMTRSKERLQTLSVRDEMTGAYNRRGMYEIYRSMLRNAKEGDALFVSVVDMDGLKYVNDTFGHSEGDFGIKTVSSTLMYVAKADEICVRSGGDEFFLVGIGKYDKNDEASRAIAFSDAIQNASESSGKPYNISASIGCVVFEDCRQVSLDSALSEADERMYRYKVKNRRHRSV